jgi:Ca-activated chloride channel homolog
LKADPDLLYLASVYFRFQDPQFALLLILLVSLFWARKHWGKQASLRVSSNWAMQQLVKRGFSHLRRSLTVLRLTALLFLILALMRPQVGRKWTEETTSGIDIMLVVDLSGSMHAHDFEIGDKLVDRLAVVKSVISRFIEARKHDRIGLVVFAEASFLVSPLTHNRAWLRQNFERLEIGVIPPNSTAIGNAIGMATNRLRDIDANANVIVLLTDGENNAGNLHPISAAEAAATFGIRIYTIGVGKSGPVMMPRQRDGRAVTDRDGNPIMDWVEFDIDEPTLREIAQLTEGKFFRATNTEGLQIIYDEIDRLEKREVTFLRHDTSTELMMLPMLLALALLLVEIILARTLLHKIP